MYRINRFILLTANTTTIITIFKSINQNKTKQQKHRSENNKNTNNNNNNSKNKDSSGRVKKKNNISYQEHILHSSVFV